MASPRLAGVGPPTCSTSLTLVRSPEWIADVNGYYRDLGVDPRATRGQIARAYFERGRDSPRLTFVVTQLLNPEVRRAYDSTPLGHVFLDQEVVARLRDDLVSRMSVGRGTVTGEASSRSNILDFLRVIDKRPCSQQDAHTDVIWPWSYYLWGTDQADTDLLRRWQGALTVALGRAGVSTQVAVGLMGGAHSEVEVVRVAGHTVALIHEQHHSSTDALAQRAVSQIQPVPSTRSERDRNMSQTAPSFRRGTDEAKEASKGTPFARTHYFSLDPNPSSPNNRAIVRLLTEHTDLIVVDQHNNIPTKRAPEDYEGTNWPSKMSAVCRNDKAFEGMYEDCFICDHVVDGKKIKRAGARSWALAVLREEVMEDGVVVGIRDQVREIAEVGEDGKPTGNVSLEKAIVVVNMGYKNFFGILEGFGKHYKTLLDRDYLITRSGSDTDTTYSIVPLEPIPVDDKGTIYDLRKPEYMDRYKPAQSLEEIVTERSSDEFYARFFDTRVEAPARKTSNGTPSDSKGAAAPPARPSAEADTDRLAALRSRVVGYGQGTDGAVEAAPAEEAAAVPTQKRAVRNFD